MHQSIYSKVIYIGSLKKTHPSETKRPFPFLVESCSRHHKARQRPLLADIAGDRYLLLLMEECAQMVCFFIVFAVTSDVKGLKTERGSL